MVLTPGTRFGPYEILSALGEGGMGDVYLARDTRLDRTVAIKAVRDELSQDLARRLRVEQEARIVAQLTHPHICTLHDIVQDGVHAYLVMEALDGGTLASRLLRAGRKGLPLLQSLMIAAEAAEGLAFAHDHGVVHQDVKPANIMLTPAGTKLLDFGVARLRSVGQDPGATVTGTPDALTRAGTLPYMAPEQLDGRGDQRADIFALGAVLYEMLTGARAFSGATTSAIIAQIVEHDPPEIGASVAPPAVARLVRKCLAKDPKVRWQTAADLADELHWIARDLEAHPTVAAGPRAWSWPTQITIGAAAAAVVAVVAMASRNSAPPATPPVSFTVDAPGGGTLVPFGDGGAPAISPDGQHLAFIAARPDGTDLLWIRALHGLTSAAIPGSEGAAGPFWSADGRQVAFFAAGDLKRAAIDGGATQTVSSNILGRSGTWNRDDAIVAATADERLVQVNVKTGAMAPVGSPAVEGERRSAPVFLPDGQRFLYKSSSPGEAAALYVGALDSQTHTLVGPTESGAIYSAGRLLFARGRDLLSQPFNLRELSLQGEPEIVLSGVYSWDQWMSPFTASPNGMLASLTGTEPAYHLAWFNRQGQRLGIIPDSIGSRNPRLSPDGTRIAMERQDPVTAGRDLWLIDLTRGIVSRLTHGPISRAVPVWSADGRRLAHAVNPESSAAVLNLDTSEIVPIVASVANETSGFCVRDLSHDGKFLLVQKTNAKSDLWLVPTTSAGSARALTNSPWGEFEGRFSPDDRFIAFSSDQSGRLQVNLMAVDGTLAPVQVSSEGGLEAVWRRDGKEIFYLNLGGILMAVDFDAGPPLRLGTPHPLFEMPSGTLWNAANHYDVAPDGQRFLVAEEIPATTPLRITVMTNWSAAAR